MLSRFFVLVGVLSGLRRWEHICLRLAGDSLLVFCAGSGMSLSTLLDKKRNSLALDQLEEILRLRFSTLGRAGE